MDKSFLRIKVISIYLLISAVCRISYSCSGFPASGYTRPTGDIRIEYNSTVPLEITCVVTNTTFLEKFPNISSYMFFKKDDINVTSDKIIRLNETSIKLLDNHPEKMTGFYNCMVNDSVLCLNNVAIGTRPQPVTDFYCIGHNYDNMTCLWTPSENYVPTNYSLSYTFPQQRAGSRPTDCNVTTEILTKKKMCFWTLYTHPFYRQVQLLYNFTLRAVNQFGSIEQVFLFDHYKHILANPPENLSCINSTVSSLLLRWLVPNSLVPFGPGIEHRVLYQCRFGPKEWQDGGLLKSKDQPEITYNLTGLKYAHDVCDIRVAIRVQTADSEDMWSSNTSVTALTSSTVPGAPPRVNIGSFQIDISTNLREIYVYWQQIPVEMRNAENFHYVVFVNGSLINNIRPSEITTSYAKFSNMSLDTSYLFTIRSNNSEGLSVESTELFVPTNNDLIDEPVLFTKVAFENGVYKLTWEQPRKGAEYVENYTLFWCSNEKDRPYQCTGYMNWTVVPATFRQYNITVQEEYITQFAISANNATSSSGMVWAPCTVIHNKHISKIKEVWITRVGSTFIELGWKLDCTDRSDLVAGYVIYYCPRARSQDLGCQTPMKNVTINKPHAESGEVIGLTPYTTYMLTVSVINKQGSQSPESDPLFNTTYEDVPTAPYGVEVISVTNSTITISWKPPERKNGHLRMYHIYFNSNKTDTSNNQTTFTLDHLQSGTTYNISVSACTQKCSQTTKPVAIKTKIGRPGTVSNAWTKLENATLKLQWIRPDAVAEGAYYEIRRTHKSHDGNVTLPTVNTTDEKYDLLNCKVSNNYDSYYVSLRAVNKDGNVTHTGQWSDDIETWCNEKRSSSGLKWMLIGLGSIIALIITILSGKRVYIHYNDMKTIDVKLPPGLDPQINTGWPQPKADISRSDEEQLLNKSFVPGNDSSGCSSGQGSGTFDSTSSVNNSTDSGTEQPKTPIEDVPKALLIIDKIPKIVETQPYVQFSEQSTSWSTNTNNTNGYSMYGMPDVSETDIELSSVMQDNHEPPYKTLEESSATTNSYVPLNNTAQDNKNLSYVMAANKNVISNILYPNIPPHGDDKAYVQVADVNGVLKDVEINNKEHNTSETATANSTNGYVSFGDMPTTKSEDSVTNKLNGYVSLGDSSVTMSPKEDSPHSTNGYVSFGDAPQVNNLPYVSHRI